MKVAVIGGGSSYTPELVNGFLKRVDRFPLQELCLMDIRPDRLELVGGFARRMVAAQGARFVIRLTSDQREAVRGASYVITQLRIGGMEARREDEYLGHRHGLIGQETTGVGGMAMALRTIPAILAIARDMSELARDALLVNFTNPAGLVTEALARYAAGVMAVGMCNVPINAKMDMLNGLHEAGIEAAPDQAVLDTLGLNHLSWHRGLTIAGEDLWPRILEITIARLNSRDEPEWDPAMIESLQMIPNSYLRYYYHTGQKLGEQENWPPSRAETVMAIESQLLKQYGEPARAGLPEDLMKRGGAYYSTVATQLLTAHYNDLHEVHVVNVPHRGAVPGWPEDWVLELPCRVGKSGFVALPTNPLPPVCYGLLAQIKMYELLTVEAAVHGDRNAAYQALMTHPLGPGVDKVETVLTDMLETNRAFIPQFSH